MLEFDINLQSVKKVSNWDLLVAIETGDKNCSTINIEKTYRLTNEPGAQQIAVGDVIWQEKWKYPFADMVAWCKNNIEGFRQTRRFHRIKEEVETLQNMIHIQYLDPQHQKGGSKKYYCMEAMEEIKQRYKTLKS